MKIGRIICFFVVTILIFGSLGSVVGLKIDKMAGKLSNSEFVFEPIQSEDSKICVSYNSMIKSRMSLSFARNRVKEDHFVVSYTPPNKVFQKRDNLIKINRVLKKDNFESDDTHYFISTEDHPDVLNEYSVDNIAFVKLVDGKDIIISEIKVFISSDRKNWVETEIGKSGIWSVGEKITIREIFPNDVKQGFHIIMIETANDRIPLAEDCFNIDNIPGETQIQNLPYLDGDVGINSSCCHEWNYGSTDIKSAASLGLHYYGLEWDNDRTKWRYKFRLTSTFKGNPSGVTYRMLEMKAIIDRSPDSLGEGFPGTGGWHVERATGPDKWDIIAQFVCDQAISALSKWIAFTLDAIELADELQECTGDASTVTWLPYTGNTKEASGFFHYDIYVPPETDWEVSFNLKAEADAIYSDHHTIRLDKEQEDWWGGDYHGDGIIVCSGTSPSAPDLVAKDIWLSSQAEDWDKNHVVSTPTAGDTVYPHFVYEWTGSETCPTHKTQIKMDGNVLGEVDVDGLPAGYYAQICGPWTATAGSHTLEGVADSNDDVDESDENNNIKQLTFSVEGGDEGDLVARDIWLSSQAEDWDKNHVVSTPTAGDTVYPHFVYEWTGSETCPTHKTQIKMDGNVLGEVDVDGLPAGYYAQICGPWTATAGSHTLEGVADSNDDVDESDENNNIKQLTFSVEGGDEGDLVARDIWLSSQAEDWDKNHVVSNPKPDDNIYFHFAYEWTGSYTCPTHRVEIWLSSEGLQCYGHISDLPGKHILKICCSQPWNAKKGEYTLTGKTDTDNDVDETNEGNNEKSITFKVEKKSKSKIRSLVEGRYLALLSFLIKIKTQFFSILTEKYQTLPFE